MGGTTDKTLEDLSKNIWKYLILRQTNVTAEYLPGILNTRADWQSRHSNDFSKWKLSPIVFQRICQEIGMPVIDLLASRLFNRIAKHFAWKPEPRSLATDAMQQEWNKEILCAFSPFLLIQRILCKIEKEKISTVILITPAWQTQSWYPNLLAISFYQPFLLPISLGVLKNIKGEDHPLVINKSLALVVWRVTGLIQASQNELPILLLTQRDKVHQLITTSPGKNEIAGASMPYKLCSRLSCMFA